MFTMLQAFLDRLSSGSKKQVPTQFCFSLSQAWYSFSFPQDPHG